MTITHINPSTLSTNPAFSQGVLAEGGRPEALVGIEVIANV